MTHNEATRETAVGETPDPLSRNIQNITGLRARFEQHVNPHQRMVERVTLWLGRPRFFYIILIVVTSWVAFNVAASHLGWQVIDPPPFYWMQGVISTTALLMTTVVLITQNRQGKLDEQRAELDLQLNLLSEQRTAKIVALLEELRRDLPQVPNRLDPEAEALTETADPHVVLTALEFQMEKALEEVSELAEEAKEVAE